MPKRFLVMILWSASLYGQPKEDPACVLDSAHDGDVIRVRGEVFSGGHDSFIEIVGCATSPATRVILVWADDPILGIDKSNLKRSPESLEFDRLVAATLPLPPNSVGTGEPRYRVVADFEGKLQVAKTAGLKRDAKGKVIGIEGFGHPMAFTRFRLLASGVSNIDSKSRSAGLVDRR